MKTYRIEGEILFLSCNHVLCVTTASERCSQWCSQWLLDRKQWQRERLVEHRIAQTERGKVCCLLIYQVSLPVLLWMCIQGVLVTNEDSNNNLFLLLKGSFHLSKWNDKHDFTTKPSKRINVLLCECLPVLPLYNWCLTSVWKSSLNPLW